jgi:hypothetical protein
MLVSGILLLLTFLCDSFYIKTFLAVSSILNTLFVFLVFSALTTDAFYFFL